jgi:capsular polysaccharide biosynthesis protein
MNNMRQVFSPVVVFVVGLLSGASIIMEWQNPWRWLFIFVFIVFGPGASFLHFFPGKDAITHLVLIVAISLSLATAITQILLYAGIWSARLAFFILIGISWFGLLSNISFRAPSQKAQVLAREIVRQPRFYLHRLRQRAWFVLVAGLLLVNLSVIYSYYIAPPIYEAVAEFVLSPKAGQDAPQPGSDPAPVAEYAAQLTNPAITESTFRLLDENLENYLKYKTTTSFQVETGRIQLRVRGPEPALAASLANSIGQTAAIQINNQRGAYTLELIEKSPIPIAPSGPNIVLNILVAFLIGLLLGSGLALLGDRTNLAWRIQ